MVAFREGPVALLTEGLEVAKSTRGLTPEEEKKAYTTAVEHFHDCQKNGAALLADHPRLANASFVVGGRALRARDVLKRCGEGSKATEVKLGDLEATLAFYEGPAKGLELGRDKLGDADAATTPQDKKKLYQEALAAFEKCIETGKTLEYKRPELKNRKFEVGAKKVTIALVIAACQKGASTARSQAAKAK